MIYDEFQQSIVVLSLVDYKLLVSHLPLIRAAFLFAGIFEPIPAAHDVLGPPALLRRLSVRVLLVVQLRRLHEQAVGVVEAGGADLVWIIETKICSFIHGLPITQEADVTQDY